MFVYGYLQDTEGLNSYLEQVRSKAFPVLKSLKTIWKAPDESSVLYYLAWMAANEGGVYILPRYGFLSQSSEGFLLPLENDEELMASVKNNDISGGWRSVGDEVHLYGIPLAILPGANRFFVEDGFVCAFAGDSSPENVKTFLRILCRDFMKQTE